MGCHLNLLPFFIIVAISLTHGAAAFPRDVSVSPRDTDALATCADIESKMSSATRVIWRKTNPLQSNLLRSIHQFIPPTTILFVDTTHQQQQTQYPMRKLTTIPKQKTAHDLAYPDAIHHWYHSSAQTSTCVVEVGSVRDLSTVMQIVGATRTPFAVKSGGHASNPGFSSTPGVHISMTRMDHVIPSADNKTVEVGFGNLWVDVYRALEPSGVNVVGGRVPGPGVGGFTLGGGYSW